MQPKRRTSGSAAAAAAAAGAAGGGAALQQAAQQQAAAPPAEAPGEAEAPLPVLDAVNAEYEKIHRVGEGTYGGRGWVPGSCSL